MAVACAPVSTPGPFCPRVSVSTAVPVASAPAAELASVTVTPRSGFTTALLAVAVVAATAMAGATELSVSVTRLVVSAAEA